MMAEKQLILIREKVLESWLRDAGTFALFGSLIGIGVLLESVALQWVGAIIGFLTIFVKAATARKSHTMTIAQARKRLDELEAE
jgi:amino acid permease